MLVYIKLFLLENKSKEIKADNPLQVGNYHHQIKAQCTFNIPLKGEKRREGVS